MASRQLINRIDIPIPEITVLKNLATEALKGHRFHVRPQLPAAAPVGIVEIEVGGADFAAPRVLPVLQVTEEELDSLHHLLDPGTVRRLHFPLYPLRSNPVPLFSRSSKIALALLLGILLLWAWRRRGGGGGGGDDDDDDDDGGGGGGGAPPLAPGGGGAPPPAPGGGGAPPPAPGGSGLRDALAGVTPGARGVLLRGLVPGPPGLGGGGRGLHEALTGVDAGPRVLIRRLVVGFIPGPPGISTNTSRAPGADAAMGNAARSSSPAISMGVSAGARDLVDGAVRLARLAAVRALLAETTVPGSDHADMELMRELMRAPGAPGSFRPCPHPHASPYPPGDVGSKWANSYIAA